MRLALAGARARKSAPRVTRAPASSTRTVPTMRPGDDSVPCRYRSEELAVLIEQWPADGVVTDERSAKCMVACIANRPKTITIEFNLQRESVSVLDDEPRTARTPDVGTSPMSPPV